MLLCYRFIQTRSLQVHSASGYAQVEEERSLHHAFLTTSLVQVPFNYALSPETSILIQDHEETELVPRNIPAANVNNRWEITKTPYCVPNAKYGSTLNALTWESLFSSTTWRTTILTGHVFSAPCRNVETPFLIRALRSQYLNYPMQIRTASRNMLMLTLYHEEQRRLVKFFSFTWT